MIKSTLSALVILACSSTAFAQTGSTPAAEPKAHDMKAGAVMVTGCVEQGAMPDKFMLSHAMMAKMDHKDAMSGDTEKSTASPHAGMATSYILEGGDNLKAHVGHKVTVTGTVDKTNMMMDADKPAMSPAPESAAGMSHDMKGGTLKVDAVKMVSSTCS